MERVLRRTSLAKAQAIKKLAKRAEKNAAIDRKVKKLQHQQVSKAPGQDILAERRNRREDWELGPLAPRRDVGTERELIGAMDGRRARLREVPREERIRFWPIVPDDRVVLLDGRDKGKIGVVKTTNSKTNGLTVSGLNMVEIKLPEWLLNREPGSRPTRSIEAEVPLSSVRLVAAITDNVLGVKKDMIVKDVALGNVWFDRQAGSQRYARYIAGLGVKLPWPRRATKEHKDQEVDTLRIDVESKTFVPTLLNPPIPSSVIDELRGKYSKFRDRHDREFIERKVEEDRSKEELTSYGPRARTPIQEKNRIVRLEKQKLGPPTLTEDMLARIGEVMARNKGLDSEKVDLEAT
ncbi:MAG: hypothetical protein M1825_006306 [Sarcosagium campestre]|nr:MAG: hypothetical protein M1825_006306 [Sarcosagium campestre]